MSDTNDHGRRPRGHDTDLQSALRELVESGDIPDAEALERIVARHPRHAAELTDFAVEWALQELLPERASSGEGRSAVPAAMRRFRTRLAELDGEPQTAPAAADAFADRSAAELAQVASALGLDKTLVAKLRDRKIVAETVPAELRQGLAAELGVSPAVIMAHLALPAAMHAGASFKATAKPEVGAKETFVEAVRRSFLSAHDKARWLASSLAADTDLG